MPTSSSLFLLLLLFLFLLTRDSLAGPVATEFLYPNFTASYLNFVDNSGVFLASPNANFVAAIANPGGQQSRFYLSLTHSATRKVVWSANRDAPAPRDGTVTLSTRGLVVSHPNGSVLWSTPRLPSPVRALRLLDSGNFLLLDAANATLWQSFDHPTDTLLSSQVLPAGSSLIASVSDNDFASGDYSLVLTTGDAIMTWKGGAQQYWSLSKDVRSFKNSNSGVAYMATNVTGLNLYSTEGKVVLQAFLPTSDFRIVKLDPTGRFHVFSYSAANASSILDDEFTAPTSNCDLPFPCLSLGVCTAGANGSTCNCPARFVQLESGNCSPANGSLPPSSSSSSSASCGGDSDLATTYIQLGSGIDYFANKFASPATSGNDISACQNLCTGNCTCLGFFYRNSSKSCYLMRNTLGSLFKRNAGETSSSIGYIKTLVSGSSPPTSGGTSKTHLIAILLPTVAAFLLIFVVVSAGIIWWKRSNDPRRLRMRRPSKRLATKEINLGRHKSSKTQSLDTDDDESTDENDGGSDTLIPGLPTRFTFKELEAATNYFRNKIGSGGFGAVYKGELPDRTTVAVKRIESAGLQGRKEFCTEIAIIGNIRHVNLVRLRGFCAQGNRRLLVYEYMNRGSLDRSLFGVGPALEWQERVDIARGAARGLAYLHAGCDHKIIHCDVKPENILLHDGGQVKISDFGLAKLLSPEQSGLFTTMRGTRGYLAPEWLTNAAISDRTDVYSFGMVLLEIVHGRKNRSGGSEECEEEEEGSGSGWSSAAAAGGGYFPLVALEGHEEGRYLQLADQRLEWRVREEEVARVVKLALCCLHEEPWLRPSMAVVVGMLEGNMEVWEPKVESLNFLRLYGRGFMEPPAAVGGGGGGSEIVEGVVALAGGDDTASRTSAVTGFAVDGSGSSNSCC
ncbi:G-type lectin S-receptor-like serine/threonine-protein kinase At5g35370 [Musa acuminata AAA Group]|uniref:G-type lectin S-receptor-like serine/threonine-protein kinase At5g35370 n=1 Tax=Musa acuminata AAA Group TaxID=214697 RepID=UPI0031D9DE9C